MVCCGLDCCCGVVKLLSFGVTVFQKKKKIGLAMGKAMLRKKKREEIIDASYNR